MPSGLVQTTAPAAEPLTLAEVKQHCRVEVDEDDALLGTFLAASREQVEILTRRQLVTATWTWTLDGFPCGAALRLPRPPLQSVTSVTYVAPDGTATLWDSANYTVDSAMEPGRLRLAYGQVWPSTQDVAQAVTIVYTAGYGDAADVPAALKVAVLLFVADLYEHREARSEMRLEDNPTIMRLLWSTRVLEA